MKKIITPEKTIQVANTLHKQNKKIVLTGGCFDLIHIGHIQLLQKAKKQADVLIVFVESDKTVRRLKGDSRPINNQLTRAKILAALEDVDYICLLPEFTSDRQYDELVIAIKPAIIATTQDDQHKEHKIRQAAQTGAKVVTVTKRLPISSSRLLKIICQDYI
ncbi:MAG: adenylyltransferase/cytidyltransferase family protein [Candidatus Levybacteria bacterium]|nr:adenylyltransferase/cytidyltransferase family protein [Candidatus Levybacteria bacterium]